ncbi:MAG: quaternary ammonium transporter [Chloroflexota bacterium]|nr:quaternary ammonium transporter [Chloroflexota bacterium]
MIGTNETDGRRLSRRTMLSGFAAAAGAALLAACGGSKATNTPQVATTAAGAATTASGQVSGGTAVTTKSAASTTAGSTTAPASTTAASSATTSSTTTAASPTTAGTRAASSVTTGTTGTTAAGSVTSGAIPNVKLSGTVKVGTKDFTEEFIVGNMYKLLLEQAGAKVDYKENLGGTPVCQAAMQSGSIDLYPEYTGTGLATVLKQPTIGLTAQQTYDQVAKGYKDQYNFVWLAPAPMNDTQALAMTQAGSQKFGIKTISDMVAKASQLTMIGPPEFQTREDGIPGIMKTYGAFKLKNYIPVDPGLKYQGLTNGQADVAVAFGTDGQIAADNLVVLQDDKNLFPISQITPVVRQQALDATPGIKAVLNAVSPMLTDKVMSTLNYEVDGKKREPAAVAQEFLTAQGLLKK